MRMFLAGLASVFAAANMKRLSADDLRHGDYFVSLRPDFGLVIYCEVIERTRYPEDDAVIADGRSRGYIFGRCYSVAETQGELGSTHISRINKKISKQSFDAAKVVGFDPALFMPPELTGAS